MRILVFSDTHGVIQPCTWAIETIRDVDLILHAGDCVRDAEDLKCLYPDIPFHYVRGNNDFSCYAPDEKVIDVCGKRIFLTHGHGLRVKYDSDYQRLIQRGDEENADIIVFGHTHIPFEERKNHLSLLNPGSVRFGNTYGVIEIEHEKIGLSVLSFPK